MIGMLLFVLARLGTFRGPFSGGTSLWRSSIWDPSERREGLIEEVAIPILNLGIRQTVVGRFELSTPVENCAEIAG